MSAFGGKADITFCGNTLSRSLLGVKRTWRVAAHVSASDPKRTFRHCNSAGHIGGTIAQTKIARSVNLVTVRSTRPS